MDVNKRTDEDIVEEVVSKNKEMFTELVYRYENKLERYVGYLTNKPEIINDVVQETFIKAYENLKSFDTTKKFSSWIYRIAHNQAINVVKKNSKTYAGLDFTFLENLTAVDSNIEESYEKDETKKLVNKCMNDLPLKYREVMSLFFLEDKSYEEISDILRMPIGTVGTRINRGKKLLKNICLKNS